MLLAILTRQLTVKEDVYNARFKKALRSSSMAFPRHGLHAFSVRHACILNPVIRPIYLSLRSNATLAGEKEPDSDPPTGPTKEASPLADTIRALMRTQPHGLAAIVAPSDLSTTRTPKGRPKVKPNATQQSALLVSSLNTVTLFPTPYVSFNIKTPSQTYRNLHDYGQFTVSGLDDPESAQAFAETYEENAVNKGKEAWRIAVGKMGRVRPEYGGRWWLTCKFRGKLSTRVGDHVIVVGEVLEAGGGPAPGGGADARFKSGLVYMDTEYRRVGGVVGVMVGAKRREVAIQKHGERLARKIDVRMRKVEPSVVRRIEPPKPGVRGESVIRYGLWDPLVRKLNSGKDET